MLVVSLVFVLILLALVVCLASSVRFLLHPLVLTFLALRLVALVQVVLGHFSLLLAAF
jgi:hypothetical protein